MELFESSLGSASGMGVHMEVTLSLSRIASINVMPHPHTLTGDSASTSCPTTVALMRLQFTEPKTFNQISYTAYPYRQSAWYICD